MMLTTTETSPRSRVTTGDQGAVPVCRGARPSGETAQVTKPAGVLPPGWTDRGHSARPHQPRSFPGRPHIARRICGGALRGDVRFPRRASPHTFKGA